MLQSASAQAALQAAQALTAGGTGTGAATNGGLTTAPADIQGGPNTVLRVIVEHMVYPIVLDVLHSIFQRFGKVLKIVTFTKNSEYIFSFKIFFFDDFNSILVEFGWSFWIFLFCKFISITVG